jgi:DNA-binding transcriptional ArsR family regulator
MGVLSDRARAVLRLAVDEGQITVCRTAEQLLVSRSVAGATLRALERAGHLDGQLVGGGQIGYRPTALGRERLDEIVREKVAAKI